MAVVILARAVSMCLALAGCQGPGQVPSQVRAAIVAALAPDSGQQVRIVRDSLPAQFPEVVVYRGNRRVPPYPSGEDSRPVFASVLTRGPLSKLVVSIDDLPDAWQAVSFRAIPDADRALQATLGLLRLTGLVTRSELIGSAAEIPAKVPQSSVRSPETISTVTAPAVARSAGGWSITFVAVKPAGVFRYSVGISRSNQLTVSRVLVTSLVRSM